MIGAMNQRAILRVACLLQCPFPQAWETEVRAVLDDRDAKNGLLKFLYARTEFQLVEQRSAAERQLIEAKHTAAMQQLEKTLHGA